MANELTYQSQYTGPQMDERFTAVAQLQAALADMETALAAKYVKPATGIPETDLDAAVQSALAKARTAVQDLSDFYTKAEVDALLATINSQQYVDVATLPTASAATMEKMYLVGPDASGYYSYYFTSYDGSAYSWVGPLGTTEISLANYATKAELSQLDQTLYSVNLANYKQWSYALGTDGKFLTNSNSKYTLIPCTPGDKIRITANSGAEARYAWFTAYIVATSGATAPLVSGTTRNAITAGQSADVIAPATAAFLYVQIRHQNTTDHTPASMAVVSDLETWEDEVEEKIESMNVIDTSQMDVLKGKINDSGVWQNTARYRHLVIPCESGESFALIGTWASAYAFLTAYATPANDDPAPLVPGTAVVTVSDGESARFTTPAGTKYLYIYAGDINSSAAAGRYSIPCKIEKISDVAALTARQNDINAKLNGVVYSGDILALNQESEFIPKFMSATKRYYTSTDSEQPHPLVFLQLSDIHANWTNVERFLKFAGKYASYIDDLVNTGDTVSGLYTDGVAGYEAIDGVADIINVIGNHDTREGNDWQAHIGLDAYNLLIAPHVSSWGVTQPADAATEGYCYFYKDYASKNIRAVFVDIMGYDSTEDTWLASVLASAKEAGYHVVIFVHFAGARSTSEEEEAVFSKVACNYTSLYPLGSSSEGLTGYNSEAYKMNDTVAAFMTNGGKFIGFVQGHYHADFVAKVAKYPGQLIYSIGATKAGEMRDFNHIVGTRDQDEFQIVSIDTVNTIVKLYKVGANYDRYGRSKGSVCVDYSTGDVLGEGF